jgi:hypothetical protein
MEETLTSSECTDEYFKRSDAVNITSPDQILGEVSRIK